MKQILLVIMIGTSLLACKKEKTERKELFGKWEWKNSTKGTAVGDTIKPAANTVALLSLKNDSTYVSYLNGQIVKQGTYQTVVVSDKKVLKFSNLEPVGGLTMQTTGTTINIENNKLHLSEVSATTPYVHHFTLSVE